MKRSVRLAFALLLAATTVFLSCNNPTSSESDPAGSQRGVKGQISGIVIDGSTGLPLSGVKVEIGGKSATTDNAGYYTISNVLPNSSDNGVNGYAASFYKSGYTAAQNDDLSIRVDPLEYLNTDPFLEKQVLLKMEDYFNTWLTQTYGNGTKVVQGTVSGSINFDGVTVSIDPPAPPAVTTFWGTVNDAGDIVGGNIKGFANSGVPFTATVTGGNINAGGITLSGSTGVTPSEVVTEAATSVTISTTSVTSSAGGNWIYSGGVYINDDTGTAVQVTSDPKNPEIPKFDLAPMDYLYFYGQSLKTVYLYPTNASITGKILVFHNNTDPPEGVQDIKIEFSSVSEPVAGEANYTAGVSGTFNSGVLTIASATFAGHYDRITLAVSGTVNGLIGSDSFIGTVSGTTTSQEFSGKLTIGSTSTDLVDAALSFTGFAPLSQNSNNQTGYFYGEGKTNNKGEFTVTGVPAGQALYIQIPSFVDKAGRYYSGKNLYSVQGSTATSFEMSSFSNGPYITQRNASVALPTIYLTADADIALVTEYELGEPNAEKRLGIYDDLTVTFSKEMDTKTFSASIELGDGVKPASLSGEFIVLDAIWDEGDTKVTLKPNIKKLAGYSESGILPYWNGDAADLSIGNLAFGTDARAKDGSILIDPVKAATPSLPVFTEIGLSLIKVQVVSAEESGARSILQQGGEVILTFNKDVLQTDGTRFYLSTTQQAWKVDDDPEKKNVIHVYNDRPVLGTVALVTELGSNEYPVHADADQINDTFPITGTMIADLAAWDINTEFLSILENPYLSKTDPQGKLNAQRVKTNLKIGEENTGWDPLQDIVLEFNQPLASSPTVLIFYSPEPDEYRTVGGTLIASLDLTNTILTIPIRSSDVLLAPGKNYYLQFIATPDSTSPADDDLEIDPRRILPSQSGTEMGPKIWITIEDEDPDRFYALDIGFSGYSYDDDITFTPWPAVPTKWWPNAVIETLVYSVDSTDAKDAARDLAFYTAPDDYTNNPKWTHVASGDITIPKGPHAAVKVPVITVPTVGSDFNMQYRGIAYDGRVIAYRTTISAPTITPTLSLSGDLVGKVGIKLNQYLTISLNGDTFKALSAGDVVTDWFLGLSDVGLSASVVVPVRTGENEVEILVSGTPSDLSSQPLVIMIPEGKTQVGASIMVSAPSSQSYDITYPDLATVSVEPPATIGGTVGLPIIAVNLIVELDGDTFKDISSSPGDVKSWFPNLPAGLNATIASDVANGSTNAVVRISGTPTETSDKTGVVVIPANVLNNIASIHAEFDDTSSTADYAIVLPTGTVSVGSNVYLPSSNVTLRTPIATDYVTFTLTGTAGFKALAANQSVTNWFTNWPSSTMTAQVVNPVAEGDKAVLVKIGGYSTVASDATISAVIPAGATTKGSAIRVEDFEDYQIVAPTASITSGTNPIDGTITSPAGPIPTNQQITITLDSGNLFSAIGTTAGAVSSWVTNIPGSVTLTNTATITANTTATIVLEFGGNATALSDQWIQITIPANATRSGVPIHITPTSSYAFDIHN